MTTIATDGSTIAGDGLSQTGWGAITGRTVQKIRVRGDAVFALSGAAAMFEPLIDWYEKKGCDPHAVPVCTREGGWALLVITKKGATLYTNQAPYADHVELPFAMGTGCDFAVGAMDAGKSPREAVEIAMRRDVGTGGDIQEVDIRRVFAQGEPVREAAE